MKKNWIASRYVRAAVCLLGVLGCVLRRWLYTVALNSRQLLPPLHPLELALWAVTAGGLVFAALWAWGQRGSGAYGDNFPAASFTEAAGHILFASGIALTVLGRDSLMGGWLGAAWKILGILSALALVAAAFCRATGRKPYSLLHGVVCLFLALHIVDHYRTWSGDPQLMNYVYALFGAMALMFSVYYLAAFEAGAGKRRMALFMDLAAVLLCLVNVSQGVDWRLYLRGAVWAGLCAPREGRL